MRKTQKQPFNATADSPHGEFPTRADKDSRRRHYPDIWLGNLSEEQLDTVWHHCHELRCIFETSHDYIPQDAFYHELWFMYQRALSELGRRICADPEDNLDD